MFPEKKRNISSGHEHIYHLLAINQSAFFHDAVWVACVEDFFF